MENKKMTVKDFVKQYKNAKTEIEKSKVLKALEITNQIPYATKVIHSQITLDSTAKRKNGVLMHDSTMRYLTYVMSIMKLYTNLSINKERPHEDYDMLREHNLIDLICEKIGDDVKEFSTVFNMVWEDMVKNENDIRIFLATQIAQFVELGGQLMESTAFIENISTLEKMIGKMKNENEKK